MNEYHNIDRAKSIVDSLLGWAMFLAKAFMFTYLVSLIFTPRPKKIEVEQPSMEEDMKLLYEHYKLHGNVCTACDLYYSINRNYCVVCRQPLVSVKKRKPKKNVRLLNA